jgi:hypothetical protein
VVGKWIKLMEHNEAFTRKITKSEVITTSKTEDL